MPLEIPDDYPLSLAARRRIVSVEASSERDLRDAIAQLDWQTVSRGGRRYVSDAERQALKAATILYVTRVVLEFAKQICEVAGTSYPEVDHLPGMVEQRIEVVALHVYLGLHDYMKEIWITDYECRSYLDAEIKRSAGWRTFLTDLAAATADHALQSTADTRNGLTNSHRVDEYIAEVRRRTDRKKFCRRDIWQDLNYVNATEFQRWQRDDPRTTPTARERFERVLNTKPHLHGKSKP